MDRLGSVDKPILFIAGALDRPEYAASGHTSNGKRVQRTSSSSLRQDTRRKSHMQRSVGTHR
jgi:hypothetical protein